jgi:hypothetical protein
MRQQERVNDFQDALRIAFDGFARSLWTAMPGIVRDVSQLVARGTVTVELAIQTLITDSAGTVTAQNIRPLVDVPVCFLGGGNMVVTFPIAAGDEALVIFADRCVDSWFQSGGVQKPADPRAHDISDGFALVGPRSLARLIQNLSTTAAQFRSLDGTTYFEIADGGVANIKAPGGCNIVGDVTVTGNLSVTGTTAGGGDVSITGAVSATKEGTFQGIEVSTHVHSGVQIGADNTGVPV